MVKFIKTAHRPGKKKIMQDIAAVEKLLNRELPEDLKIFIVEAAGTSPEPPKFPIQNFPNNPYDGCYDFVGGTDSSLVETVKCYQGRMPDGFFPIGWTGFGDVICYVLEGEDAGSIWYWDHEAELPAPYVDRSNCYLCAKSLAEFINSFFGNEDDEDDEDNKYDEDDPYPYVEFVKEFRPGKKKIIQDIAAVEELLNRELPEDLKNFIVKAAGTYPYPHCFPVQNFPDKPYAECDGFWGNTRESLVKIVKGYQGRIPDGFFPIGWTGFGDVICYVLEGEDVGSIWYWDHEAELPAACVDRSNCYLCAESLTEFMNSFFDLADGDYDDDDDDEEDSPPEVEGTKISDREIMSYQDVCYMFSFDSFSDKKIAKKQMEDINKKMADLFYGIINDKCSAEEFCDGLFRLLERLHDISLNIPESDLKKWYEDLSGKPLEREEWHKMSSPLESNIQLMSYNLLHFLLDKKPKLAKSPFFYQFVRKVILDPRFGRGRASFIEYLLPKVKTFEGIDFTPFLKDRRYAGSVITAFLRLKDGCFVKEAEKILESDPQNSYRRREIRRYIKLHKGTH